MIKIPAIKLLNVVIRMTIPANANHPLLVDFVVPKILRQTTLFMLIARRSAVYIVDYSKVTH